MGTSTGAGSATIDSANANRYTVNVVIEGIVECVERPEGRLLKEVGCDRGNAAFVSSPQIVIGFDDVLPYPRDRTSHLIRFLNLAQHHPAFLTTS